MGSAQTSSRRKSGRRGAACLCVAAAGLAGALCAILSNAGARHRLELAEHEALQALSNLETEAEAALGVVMHQQAQPAAQGGAGAAGAAGAGAVGAAQQVQATQRPPRAAAAASGKPTAPLDTSGLGADTCGAGAGARVEYNGEVVQWGTQNVQPDAAACCRSCAKQAAKWASGDKVERCNTWVFCGKEGGCNGGKSKQGECWLKHNARADGAGVMSKGEECDWTSGLSLSPEETADLVPFKDPSRVYRTLTTADDKIYSQWQMRVHYYQWKKVKAMEGSEHMGGFTRILHSGHADKLMDEIPTDVVDPLPPHMTKGFVVLSRPNAIDQWLRTFADKYPEQYYIMSEPDHLWLRPIPNLMLGEHTPAAFPFFYITPQKTPDITNKFLDKKISAKEMKMIDPIGNSPVMISKGDLRRIAPAWHNVSLAIKHDAEADKAWGWVLEMYGYSFAAWNAGIHHKLYPNFMAQPPWDKAISDFYILHYTYGCDYNEKGVFTPGKVGAWRFDKRRFSGRYPPKTYPPFPPKVPELTRKLVDIVMEAANALPDWPDEPLDHM